MYMPESFIFDISMASKLAKLIDKSLFLLSYFVSGVLSPVGG